MSLLAGGQGFTIKVDENSPTGDPAAIFRAVNYDSMASITLAATIPAAQSTNFQLVSGRLFKLVQWAKTHFFPLLVDELRVIGNLNYETLRDSNAHSFTLPIVASYASLSSTSTFTVSVVDVDEQPTSCIRASTSTVIPNGDINYVNVSAITSPLTSIQTIQTVRCNDPDKYTESFRKLNASMVTLTQNFQTTCTTATASTTQTQSCTLDGKNFF